MNSMHSQSYHGSTFHTPVWIPCTHNLTQPPHLTHSIFKTLLSPSPTYWLFTTCGRVEDLPTSGVRQGILESPRFLISLIIPETQRWHTVLDLRPHLFEQNQEQNDATTAIPEVITKYCSWTTLLPQPQQIKQKFMSAIDSEYKLHQKGLHNWLPVGIEFESPIDKCAFLTFTSCCPGNWATLNFYKTIPILLE